MGLEAIANQIQEENARKAAADSFFRAKNQPVVEYAQTAEQRNKTRNSIIDKLGYKALETINYVLSNTGRDAHAGGLYSASRQALSYEAKLCPEARKLHDEGFNLSQDRKLDEAIEKYKKAIKIEPDNPLLFHQLGIVYKKKGELGLAIEQYKESLKLNDKYSDAYLSLGVSHCKLGNKEFAKEFFNKYFELSPDTPYRKQIMKMIK